MLLLELRAQRKSNQRENNEPARVQIDRDIQNAPDPNSRTLLHFAPKRIIAKLASCVRVSTACARKHATQPPRAPQVARNQQLMIGAQLADRSSVVTKAAKLGSITEMAAMTQDPLEFAVIGLSVVGSISVAVAVEWIGLWGLMKMMPAPEPTIEAAAPVAASPEAATALAAEPPAELQAVLNS